MDIFDFEAEYSCGDMILTYLGRNVFPEVIMDPDIHSDTEPSGPSNSDLAKFTCLCCKVRFKSLSLQKAHFKTQWHSYNLKRKICNLEPIGLDNFDKILPSENASNVKPPKPDITPKNSQADDDDDDDWDDIEQQSDDDEEEQEERLLSRVIDSKTCLFCGRKSSDIGKNIQHMNSSHGFFIPEEKYMIDIDGFMEYLGFKVGAGGVCLWCNKQFASFHGVRLHMISKDHCKILYDQEKASEFKEFYDYSTQEHINMRPLNQLAIPKKRVSRMQPRILANPKTHGSKGNLHVALHKGNLGVVAGSYQAKNIKKFDAYRAKIILRTGMANNYTMRGRLRQQNPI